MEKRINTKFCLKLGETATETQEILKTLYIEVTLSRLSAFEWFDILENCRR